MNASQDSCDALYDCSCEELNEVIEIARQNGALGSRLTGAGRGGCCVSIVRKDQVRGALSVRWRCGARTNFWLVPRRLR